MTHFTDSLLIIYVLLWLVILLFTAKRTAEPNNPFNSFPAILAIFSALTFSAYVSNPFMQTQVQVTGILLCAGVLIARNLLAKRNDKD